MTIILLKKDYKIIGTSTNNPSRVILEIDKDTLKNITSRKRISNKESSLRDYIVSGDIDKLENIGENYSSVNSLISSMK